MEQTLSCNCALHQAHPSGWRLSHFHARPSKLCSLRARSHRLAIGLNHQRAVLAPDKRKIEVCPYFIFQDSWGYDMCARWLVCHLATAGTQGRAPCPCRAELWRRGECPWRAGYSLRTLGRSTVWRLLSRHTPQPSYTVGRVQLGWRLGDWSASKWSCS